MLSQHYLNSNKVLQIDYWWFPSIKSTSTFFIAFFVTSVSPASGDELKSSLCPSFRILLEGLHFRKPQCHRLQPCLLSATWWFSSTLSWGRKVYYVLLGFELSLYDLLWARGIFVDVMKAEMWNKLLWFWLGLSCFIYHHGNHMFQVIMGLRMKHMEQT
jgi:hypothetical protein